MALPKKKTRMDFQHAHMRRSLPAALETYLEANGYCLRAMSAMNQWAVAAQAELIYPLTKQDIEESAPQQAEELIQDILLSNFTLMEDGSFQRGDVRLYVQTHEARDQVRKNRQIEHEQRASEEHVYESINEMNKTLNQEARGLAKVEPGMFGGETVPDLSQSASGGLDELNRSRRMADAVSGQQEE